MSHIAPVTADFWPWRARMASRILQSYPFERGFFRLYRTMQSSLRLPRHMIINLDRTSSLKIYCDLEEYMQWWIYSYGLGSEPDFALMRRVLRPGDHFVDVGANIGIFSMLASISVGPAGMIYAFEPLPANQVLLEANLALNKLDNVKVLKLALSDVDGEVDLFPSTNGNLGMTSLSSQGTKGRPLRVNARRLDSLITDGLIERCDVMKIDIEGAEALALSGMRRLFMEHPPRAVLIEVSEALLAHFSSTPGELITFFHGFGYLWYRGTAKGLVRLSDLDVRGHQNLWALLPPG